MFFELPTKMKKENIYFPFLYINIQPPPNEKATHIDYTISWLVSSSSALPNHLHLQIQQLFLFTFLLYILFMYTSFQLVMLTTYNNKLGSIYPQFYIFLFLATQKAPENTNLPIFRFLFDQKC